MISHTSGLLMVWAWLYLALAVVAALKPTPLPDVEADGFQARKDVRLTPHNGPQPNIIGGQDADEFEYPFAAAFMLPSMDFPSWRAKCSGALIHPYYVLTAAHCSLYPGSTVLIGQTNLEESVDARGMSVQATVDQFIRHPLYAGHSRYGYDVALVKLVYPVHIRPVAIEFSGDLTPEFEHESATAIGYGTLQETSDLTAVLQEITETLTPVCDCIQEGLESTFGDDPMFATDVIMSRSMCYLPSSTSHRVCLGDSGGPLMTGNSSDTYRVRGVVNFGTGCVPLLPDYYARVSAYAGWITSVTGDLSSSGATETRFWYAPQDTWKSLTAASSNVDQASHKFCLANGYGGGFNVRQVLPSGTMCFNSTIMTIKRTLSVGAPKSASPVNLRRLTARWARSQSCSTGVWNGVYKVTPKKKKKMEIICFPLTHPNLMTVYAKRVDLDLDPSVNATNELFDRAGLLFARQTGFQAGVWNGDINDTHIGLVLMGSSYEWDYTAPPLAEIHDSYQMQTCSAQLAENCSLGMFELPRGTTNFSDGWDIQYPNNAKRCWVIPPRSNTTTTTVHFETLQTEQDADILTIYGISNYSTETKQVFGMTGPLMTVSGTTLPATDLVAAPGQTLYVTFQSNAANQGSGFSALLFYNLPPKSPCNPLLSKAGCAKFAKQCRWFRKRCVPKP